MNAPHAGRIALRSSLVVIACSTAFAQWSADPASNLAVCDEANDQAVPKIAAVGDGSTWLGWFDHRGAGYEVYVQLLDRDGNAAFATDGLLVSSNTQSTSLVDWDLIADSAGNAVLVFTDTRAGSDLDVYAYRISPSGQFLWGPNGVALSNNADFEPSPRCAELTDGSFVFVWSRIPSSGTGSIRVQRLDASGAPLYVADGLAIDGLTNEKPGFAQVVAAESERYVVLWLRNTATFSSPRHIYAQKLDAGGAALWNSGNPVVVFDASVPIAYWPVVEPDLGGGVWIAWHRAAGSFFESFVQYLSDAGVENFPHDGVSLSLEANVMKLYPSLALLPSGDAIAVFHRRNVAQSQWGVGAQRISITGARSWTDDGVVLAALDGANESFERALPFGEGAIALWFESPSPYTASSVVATRLDANGTPVWGATPVTVSSNPASKDDLEAVVDATGIVRAVWDDERTSGGDIYAQDVHHDGALGPIVTCTATTYCSGAPNSVGPGASIGWLGSTSAELNNLQLTASGCPPLKSAIFFYGAGQTAGTPFKNGLLCTTMPLVRLPLTDTDEDGNAVFPLDLANPPVPAGQIAPGSSWSFQLWYRDPDAPPHYTNTSDALRASFCP